MVGPDNSALSPTVSPLAAFRRRIGHWWDRLKNRFRARQWVHRTSPGEHDLKDAVVPGAYPKLLLPEMLHVLDLPPDRVESEYPGISDDLEWVCARCADKARCRRELDNDTAGLHFREFCANAPTLEALAAEAAGEVNRQDPDDTEADSER
jgi:hypothetical protein